MKGMLLAAIAVLGLVDGVATFAVPMARQGVLILVAVAAYLYGWRLTVRYAWWILGAVASLGVVLGYFSERDPFNTLLTFGFFVVLPWLIGRFRRQQADLIAAGADRVKRLERERELIAGRARAQERARIATDMHDSLGHELALIALRAGALELSPDLSEENRQAAAALRHNAVDATDRLRETIGILRDEPAPAEPLDESVEVLVGRAAEAGMRVTLETDETPLPPLAAKTVHRVVQESLTNAARYAPGAEVAVVVGVADAVATVSVRNSGRHVEVQSGKGSGLVGLEERVRLLGGAFRAGPVEGGFEVRAEVPFENAKIDATWQGNR
ncbi:sensor histidine kinase [Glycomyces sp. NPDC048151]|uniref:sensor histidine kinase n=1 Tax=Glycomyces sp. NPDC048151 TaxID=3364002 RepID=UPI00371EF3B8